MRLACLRCSCCRSISVYCIVAGESLYIAYMPGMLEMLLLQPASRVTHTCNTFSYYTSPLATLSRIATHPSPCRRRPGA